MIDKKLSFPLPRPWYGESFHTRQIGPINFLVGPNGSGKSQFARALLGQLETSRLLGTDRLNHMASSDPLRRSVIGDHFAQGFSKNQFNYYKEAGKDGSGIDAFVLLEERMDLRIQVEATLSHLFGREISFEWDSGFLVAKARRRDTNDSYRLDREECHGIKELLVLLTHLYSNDHRYLIIDEPELNLHPQYQAFFMQEVHKLAGDPNTDERKKIFFLITHSPFILDFKSDDDVNSVISFSLDYSVPKQILDRDSTVSTKPLFLARRLNAHHKQLFFSDNPIFVEGILDAYLIEAMQEARGVSVAGAGSCIIDVGGCEEVNRYLKLCQKLGKKAHFLYDLDSLFTGHIRDCIKDDTSVQSFLASAGLGNDFGKYCGELEGRLTDIITKILDTPTNGQSSQLVEFLKDLGERNSWDKAKWAKARTAVMTAISIDKEAEAMVSATSEALVKDIEGRLKQIIIILKEKNIHLLSGGTIERYLPYYSGNPYKITESAKRKAVFEEIEEMTKPMSEKELSSRYGELHHSVCDFPSKADVDVDQVLRNYLGRYIHELQNAARNNPTWECAEVQDHLNALMAPFAKIISVRKLDRRSSNEFTAVIEIAQMLGQGKRNVQVGSHTNAGMGDFQIEFAP